MRAPAHPSPPPKNSVAPMLDLSTYVMTGSKGSIRPWPSLLSISQDDSSRDPISNDNKKNKAPLASANLGRLSCLGKQSRCTPRPPGQAILAECSSWAMPHLHEGKRSGRDKGGTHVGCWLVFPAPGDSESGLSHNVKHFPDTGVIYSSTEAYRCKHDRCSIMIHDESHNINTIYIYIQIVFPPLCPYTLRLKFT